MKSPLLALSLKKLDNLNVHEHADVEGLYEDLNGDLVSVIAQTTNDLSQRALFRARFTVVATRSKETGMWGVFVNCECYTSLEIMSLWQARAWDIVRERLPEFVERIRGAVWHAGLWGGPNSLHWIAVNSYDPTLLPFALRSRQNPDYFIEPRAGSPQERVTHVQFLEIVNRLEEAIRSWTTNHVRKAQQTLVTRDSRPMRHVELSIPPIGILTQFADRPESDSQGALSIAEMRCEIEAKLTLPREFYEQWLVGSEEMRRRRDAALPHDN